MDCSPKRSQQIPTLACWQYLYLSKHGPPLMFTWVRAQIKAPAPLGGVTVSLLWHFLCPSSASPLEQVHPFSFAVFKLDLVLLCAGFEGEDFGCTPGHKKWSNSHEMIASSGANAGRFLLKVTTRRPQAISLNMLQLEACEFLVSKCRDSALAGILVVCRIFKEVK